MVATLNIATGTISDYWGPIPINGLMPKMTYPEIEEVVEKQLIKLVKEASVAEGEERRELMTQIVRIEMMKETVIFRFG